MRAVLKFDVKFVWIDKFKMLGANLNKMERRKSSEQTKAQI
nr:hypothetical protein [uncultured Campylobacter sp.]